MLTGFVRKVCCAIELLKVGGIKEFFRQLKRQIYCKDTYIGLEKNLQENGNLAQTQCKIKYSLGLATKKDIDEILQKAKTESKESVYDLVFRKWLYECGFHNWHIARAVDTDEICFMQSVIHSENNHTDNGNIKNCFAKLKEGEALLEGAYTFEKYRGNRLHPSVVFDILEIYRKKGFKHVITYIKDDNEASLKGAERLGFTQFQEVHKLNFLFKKKIKIKRIDNLDKLNGKIHELGVLSNRPSLPPEDLNTKRKAQRRQLIR